jgi:hypothetical protein
MHINNHSSDKYDFVAPEKDAPYEVAIPVDPEAPSVDLRDLSNVPEEVATELAIVNMEDLFEE